MTAKGKITTKGLSPGRVILIDREPDGTCSIATVKRGAVDAIVLGIDPNNSFRTIRYNVVTDRGTVYGMTGAQTHFLAKPDSLNQCQWTRDDICGFINATDCRRHWAVLRNQKGNDQ